jgi:hypothetical protein
MRTFVPWPGALSSTTRPPCASLMARTIDKPSPAPFVRRDRAVLARQNRSNA